MGLRLDHGAMGAPRYERTDLVHGCDPNWIAYLDLLLPLHFDVHG